MTANETAALRAEFLTIIDLWVRKIYDDMGGVGGRVRVTADNGSVDGVKELVVKGGDGAAIATAVEDLGDGKARLVVDVRYK